MKKNPIGCRYCRDCPGCIGRIPGMALVAVNARVCHVADQEITSREGHHAVPGDRALETFLAD